MVHRWRALVLLLSSSCHLRSPTVNNGADLVTDAADIHGNHDALIDGNHDALSDAGAGDNGAGPLRIHPSNRRYLADGSGRVVYLTGSHTWRTIQDAATSP